MAIGEGTKKVWLKTVKKCARISGGDILNKQKGNFFLLPNKIFEEGLTPMEFTVYGFLTSRGDAKGQSFYSVPNISKACGMCENSCRKAIRGLTEKGYVDVSQRYFESARQSNLYTVHKI